MQANLQLLSLDSLFKLLGERQRILHRSKYRKATQAIIEDNEKEIVRVQQAISDKQENLTPLHP